MATADLTERLEAAVARLERVARKLGGGGGDDEGGTPEWVTQYEALVNTEVAAVVRTCKALKIPNYPEIIEAAFGETLAFLKKAATSKKPSSAELMAAVAPVSAKLTAGDEAKIKGGRDVKDHNTACAELVQSLQWLVMTPPSGVPVSHLQAQKEAVEFNLNRVLKTKKDDPATKEWNLAMRKLCDRHLELVKEFFATGLIWNPKGGAIGAATAQTSAKASAPATKKAGPAAGAKASASTSASATADAGGTTAVFAELSKGLAVTKGLKKVEDKDKSKYRKDRTGKVDMPTKKAAARRSKGAASTKYVGGRWMMENYDESVEVMDKADVKSNVYVTMCDETTIEIKNKVKSVTIDSCIKARVIIDEVISTVEMVNCKGVTVIIRKKAPTISVDKSQSPRIILTPESFAVMPEVYTSNVSAMNIEIPGATPDADPVDIPVPEQFITKIDPTTRAVKTIEVVHG